MNEILHLIFEIIVVLCEIWLIVWLVCFVLGLLNVAWRWWMFPFGPAMPQSIGTFILALAIVVVGKAHGFGF